MKYTLEDIQGALRNADIDIRIVSSVLDDLRHMGDEEQADANASPREKWDTVVILNEDQATNEAGYGWVVKIPEGDSPMAVIERLQQAGGAFNLTRKGQRVPVHNIAEAIENYKPAIMADLYKVKVVTKEQVVVVHSNGSLPVLTPNN